MNICFLWRGWLIAAVVCLVLLGMPAPHLLAQGSAPAAPILLTPQDGALTTGASHPPLGIPTLAWQPAVGATKYQVQISVSSGFAATVVDVTTDNTSYTPLLALGNGIFYWRVRAAAGNNWGPYAAPCSFQVDWGDNGAIHPTLL